MINRLLNNLLKDHRVFAPVRNKEGIKIKEIKRAQEVDYSAEIPLNSWKNIFLPPKEDLLFFKDGIIKEPASQSLKKIAVWGMNILDLRALGLWELVFSKDFYYQKRRKNILIIGLSVGAPFEFKDWQIFSHNLEENILEHLPFDIFLEKQINNQFKIYASTDKGEEVLEKNNIKDYEHLEFSGLIPEEGPDKKMLALKEKMSKSKVSKKVWQELGRTCLACGKCSIVCPTCFCFDIFDEPENKNEFKRIRAWGNCFYPEFSKVSEGKVFLDNIAKKIHFWYEHKFFRIPDEYKIPGCVSCLRCNNVCPAGIKIEKTLNSL